MNAKRDTLRNLMDQFQVGMWINFTTTAGLPTCGQIIRSKYPIYIVVQFKHSERKIWF